MYKVLEKMNSLSLSQSVKKLLSENDDNSLYLEQFIIERIHKYTMQRTPKYWRFVFDRTLEWIDWAWDKNPEYRYKLLTTNSNIEFEDEQEWLSDAIISEAENGDEDSLFEDLIQNLMSNHNLEPAFPELLF